MRLILGPRNRCCMLLPESRRRRRLYPSPDIRIQKQQLGPVELGLELRPNRPLEPDCPNTKTDTTIWFLHDERGSRNFVELKSTTIQNTLETTRCRCRIIMACMKGRSWYIKTSRLSITCSIRSVNIFPITIPLSYVSTTDLILLWVRAVDMF